jgi:hypothetical protein
VSGVWQTNKKPGFLGQKNVADFENQNGTRQINHLLISQ